MHSTVYRALERSRAEVAAAQTGLVPLAAPVESELLQTAGVPRISDAQRSDNLTALWALLSCTTEVERLRVCRQAPQLAKLRPAVLRGRLQHLAEALCISAAEAASMTRRCPVLLTLARERVTANAKALSHEAFGRKLAATSTAEHVQPALVARDLARVLRQLPNLLTLSSETLCTKMQQLCGGLGMERGDVQRMFTAYPSLLASNPGSVLAKVSVPDRAAPPAMLKRTCSLVGFGVGCPVRTLG